MGLDASRSRIRFPESVGERKKGFVPRDAEELSRLGGATGRRAVVSPSIKYRRPLLIELSPLP